MYSDTPRTNSLHYQPKPTAPKGIRAKPRWWGTVLGGIIAALALLFCAPVLESSIERVTLTVRPPATAQRQKSTASAEERQLRRSIAQLRRRFRQLTPTSHYLIVDTANNRIFVKAGDRVVHEGICSTGSYVMLRAGDQRTWVFKTPRGMFRVHGKLEAPVWRKPDWAFIEEGRQPPPPMHPDRFEFGVLGEYALAFGDGYLVHGTLYKRLLGMPVTHGCVRLGDEDLRVVYHKLQEGSKIFVY